MLLQGEGFPGLIQLIYAYLETIDVEATERKKIDEYMDLIRRRASGTSPLFVDVRFSY